MKIRILISTFFVCFLAISQTVPNTTTFSLYDVQEALGLSSGSSLQDCFDNANSDFFDGDYQGEKNSLLNFRNYGPKDLVLADLIYNYVYSSSGANLPDSNLFCKDAPPMVYVYGSSFAFEKNIYKDISGSQLAPPGWYFITDQVIVPEDKSYKYWNGSAWTGQTYSTNCSSLSDPFTSTSAMLSTGLSHSEACGDEFENSYWIDSGTTFTGSNSTNKIYRDQHGALFGASPEFPLFFSNGNVSREWNGTTLFGNQFCPGQGPTLDPIQTSLGITLNGACDAQNNSIYVTRYIPDGQTFSSATEIYMDSSGNTLATSGYYAVLGAVRQWNGTAFVGGIQFCP